MRRNEIDWEGEAADLAFKIAMLNVEIEELKEKLQAKDPKVTPKVNPKVCPPCNNNCNQGRTCPARVDS